MIYNGYDIDIYIKLTYRYLLPSLKKKNQKAHSCLSNYSLISPSTPQLLMNASLSPKKKKKLKDTKQPIKNRFHHFMETF